MECTCTIRTSVGLALCQLREKHGMTLTHNSQDLELSIERSSNTPLAPLGSHPAMESDLTGRGTKMPAKAKTGASGPLAGM